MRGAHCRDCIQRSCRQAEVDEANPSLSLVWYKYIARRYVTVDQALFAKVLEGREDFGANPHTPLAVTLHLVPLVLEGRPHDILKL